MRDLVFVEQSSPAQKVWTTPLAKLLLKMKEAVSQAQDDARLSEQTKNEFLQRYDKLVKRADRLNPPPKRKAQTDAPQKQSPQKQSPLQPTPRRVINRLQKWRDEVLRFMADKAVPFDNNGSERDLRMVKLQQKISGCFRTPDGARKQGHSLLYSLERALNGKPLLFQ